MNQPTKAQALAALRMAVKYIDSRVLCLCDECPADTGFMIKGCTRRYSNFTCPTLIRNHFLALAKKGEKNGK